MLKSCFTQGVETSFLSSHLIDQQRSSTKPGPGSNLRSSPNSTLSRYTRVIATRSLNIVKSLQTDSESFKHECERLRREHSDQATLVRDLQARNSAQERELGELAVKVSRQLEADRCQRELMVAQSSYEQAMSAIRAMEEAMREVASEARKVADR